MAAADPPDDARSPTRTEEALRVTINTCGMNNAQ